MRQLKILKQVTKREEVSLDKYLHDISKMEMVTPEEEVLLAKQIKSGDEKALRRLVNANLRFVVSVSKQYQNQGLSLVDLINEGNMGLIKAAKRFDETRGFKFISYAVWWIRQAILHALAEQSRVVRLPSNKIGAINKINKIKGILEQEYERPPTDEEIAEEMDLSVDEIKKLLSTAKKHLSMDAPLSGDDSEEYNMYDVLHNDEDTNSDKEVLGVSLRQEIKNMLSLLTKRESQILTMYFGLERKPPLTLEEIGLELELTRERVRQIKQRALARLKKSTRNEDLKAYLG